MARALTSLGVAGLLVAVLLPGGIGLLGGAAAGPGGGPVLQEDGIYAGAAASQAPPENLGGQGAPGATSVDPDAAYDADATLLAIGAGESPALRDGDPKAGSGAERLQAAAPANPLLIGSLALLALGIALFGLRFAARRLR
jgi:hypothetical protein